MTITCVAVGDGSRLWVEANGLDLLPLDAVVVRVDGREEKAMVLVTPEQIVRGDPLISGSILEVVRPAPTVRDDTLPGSQMPYLSARVRVAGRAGSVVAIDPVAESVSVDMGGEIAKVKRAEIQDGT